MSEVDIALEMARGGRLVRDFWLSDVGKLINARVNEVERRYLDASIDPKIDQIDLDRVRIEYAIVRKVVDWLGEIVAAGMEAEELLDIALEEEMKTEDIAEGDIDGQA